jgi:UDP-N-acetylmuramyl pentapeptide phosphotransferase/UDP-N-acetylglucosamine-1-phosphate transferase
VPALPLIVSTIAALLLAGPVVRFLVSGGHVRANYRGIDVACPLGLLIVVAAVFALVPLALVAGLFDTDALDIAGLFLVLGVALLGLADDAYAGESRGWRGHARAVAGGGFSTGLLKAAGTLGLALAWSALTQDGVADFLLAALVIVLTTNIFNLLDLRPGRSVKAFVGLAVVCSLVAFDVEPLLELGLWAGPIVVAGILDLRERGMLGDTGSNVVGVVAGLWLVLTLDTTGLAIAAGLLVVITVYGELRSINSLIEGTPGLRHLDSIGRVRASA